MAKRKTYCVVTKKVVRGRFYYENEIVVKKRYMSRKNVIDFLLIRCSDISNAAKYLNTKYKTVDEFLESDFNENSFSKNFWGMENEAIFIARNTGKATNVYSLINEAIKEKEKTPKKRKKEKKITPIFRYDSVPYTGGYFGHPWRDTHGTKQRYLDYAVYKKGMVEIEVEDSTYNEKIHGMSTNPSKYWGKHGRSMYLSKSWKKDKKCKRQWMKHMDSNAKNCIGAIPDFSLEEEILLRDELSSNREDFMI